MSNAHVQVEGLESRLMMSRPQQPVPFLVENFTTPTWCAEEDNVNLPISIGSRATRFSFTVEARHPGYPVQEDHRDADFTNCPPAPPSSGLPQQSFKIYDDHVGTAIEAVRDPNFHRPGMAVRAGRVAAANVHFIRLIRKIADADSWPEVLVLYSDGNLRVKPQAPREGGDPSFAGDPVFGSSVIIGPAPRSERPVAQIRSVAYVPSKRAFKVKYQAGGSATLRVQRADRQVTRVEIAARYVAAPDTPFATVRSMFVAEANADVDTVWWHDGSGAIQRMGINSFTSARGGSFAFGRSIRSLHNTSAPDLWVGGVSAKPR